MLARSTGWPGAGAVDDIGDENGADAAAPLLRSNQVTSATARAIVAMPIATHGTIVCAFHCTGAAGAVSDVPHSWHARDPGLTSVPQDGQTDTMGDPQ